MHRLVAPPFRLVLGLLGVVMASHAVGAPSAVLPGDADRWIRVEAGRVTVITNSRPERALAILEQLDAVERVLLLLAPRDRAVVWPLLRVYAFDEPEHFAPYRPSYEGQPADVVGWFVSTLDGGFLAIDATEAAGRIAALHHELVHAWLAANHPRAPLWIHEGVAEYFGSFTVENAAAIVGEALDHHTAWLAREPLLEISRMMELGPADPQYHERDRQGIYYAQCWALMHMLAQSEQRREGLHEFLRRLHAGETAAAAIEPAFGISLTRLERELTEYVGRGDFVAQRLALAPVMRQSPVPVITRLAPLEAVLELGDLLARSENTNQDLAVRHFDEVLAQQPRSVRALRGMAIVRANAGEHGAALELLEQALAVDANDPDVHLQIGLALVDEVFDAAQSTGALAGFAPPPALLRARAHLEAALRVRPGHVPTLAGLELTHLPDPAAAAGIAASDSLISRAIEERRFDQARALAQRLVRSAEDPQARSDAQALLRSIDAAATASVAAGRYERAVRFVADGDLESARRELRALLEIDALDPRVEARAREFLDTLGG